MIRLLTHSKTCLKSSSSSTTNSIVSKITQKLNFSTSTSTGSNLAAVTSLSLPGGTIHSHTKRDVLLSASSSPSSLTFSGGQNCLTSSLYQSSPSALAAYTQSKPSLIHPVGSSPLIIEAFTYIATRATSLFFAGAGVTWSYLKAREEWNKRSFLRRINLSLNTFSNDGTLRIRTLFEKDIREVFMGNTRAANIVLEAAKKTTLQDPILRLPEKDSWFIYTTILNEISSMFAIGHVYTDMMSHPKPMFVNKGFIGPAQNLSRAEFHNRISGGIFGVAPPSEQEIQKSLEKVLNAVDSSQEKGNAATGSVNAANNNDTKNNNNNNNNNTTTSSAASSATATATTSQSVLDAASLSTAVHPLSVYSADSELNERYCFTLTREVASEVRFEKIRIMMVKESTLANWFKLFKEQAAVDKSITLENEVRHQVGRWAALSQFAKLYHEQIELEKKNGGSLNIDSQHLWMRVALPLPIKNNV